MNELEHLLNAETERNMKHKSAKQSVSNKIYSNTIREALSSPCAHAEAPQQHAAIAKTKAKLI